MTDNELPAAPLKPRRRWYQYSLRTLLLLTLLCAIGLKAGVVWQHQKRMAIARNWARACLDQDYPDFEKMTWDKPWPTLPPCPTTLDEKLHDLILKLAVTRLESPRERIAGLRILMESDPAHALPMLREALHDERDPTVRAVELRLIGLYRDASTADLVFEFLHDPDDGVRAAAADALGLIHCPAYVILADSNSFNGETVFRSDPLINISSLILSVKYHGKVPNTVSSDDGLPMNPVELSASIRVALETMMLNGLSGEERTAAARALLNWPPADYRFRIAEWGVWINDSGQLKLVKSVLDEIPPFVHRTGNVVTSLSDRLNEIEFIDKPIIHVTVDRPLAVKLEVLVSQGRPWFAYPRPDDFAMVTDSMFGWVKNNKGDWTKDSKPEEALARFDNSHLPELKPTAEGYPFLLPRHRKFGANGGPMGTIRNEIADLGLCWQSLIVSPDRQNWMTPPPIEDRSRYGWWERLRSVPSSWVSSQGESERFLYYDGPTHRPSPVQSRINGNKLHLESLPMPQSYGSEQWEPQQCVVSKACGDHGTKRYGFYIEVARGNTKAWNVPIADGKSEVDLERLTPMTAAAAQKNFLNMLTDYGLTAEEAAGLADVWKPQFWQTPGKRLLVVLTAKDYDAMCPLAVRPRPTEVVRLGVLLTEF